MKKIANIILSIVAVVFLALGVAYTLCPVVPYVKYTYYDCTRTQWKNEHDLKESSIYYIFKLDKTYERYSLYFNSYTLDTIGSFKYQDEVLYLFPNEHFRDCEISIDKCEVISPTGVYEVHFKAAFNPTLIFYLVGAGAIVALICVNRRHKKYEEVREVRQERKPRIDPRYERRRRR